MSTITPEFTGKCVRCSQQVPPGALVCEHCHALVHSEELAGLAAGAKAAETAGEMGRAQELWRAALRLLPSDSKQAEWIKQHAEALERDGRARKAAGAAAWTQPTEAGLTALAADERNVPRRPGLQLTSLLSFVAFVAIYAAASGVKFGIGFGMLILIHEMGHFIDIKRRGLPADMPVFLPGLGAYVRWQAMGVPLATRAAVSLAGPLAGFFAALACAVLWWQTGDPLWAALARSGAILNLLNMIPVWVLDGGQAALALNKAEHIALVAAGIVLWLALGQRLFLLVALGAGYRAFFGAGLSAYSSRATIIYFVVVLTGLGVIIRLMPGTGLGLN